MSNQKDREILESEQREARLRVFYQASCGIEGF